MPPLTQQVTLRFDQEMFDAICRDAEENGRTFSQTVRFRLEQVYGRKHREGHREDRQHRRDDQPHPPME